MIPRFRRLPGWLSAFVEKRPILCLAIVIAYIVVPIDVLPELLIGPLGAFDDALVGLAMLSLLKHAAKVRLTGHRDAPAPDGGGPSRLPTTEKPPLEIDRRRREHEPRPPSRERRSDRRFGGQRPGRRP